VDGAEQGVRPGPARGGPEGLALDRRESFVADERERLGLLQDMPAELEKELVPYYEEGAEGDLFTQDGEAAARDDFEFYNAAGQLQGDPAELQVEDFWDLGPAKAALSAVEGSGS
jgi:NitT/TauT family transport system substrate-binding protein